MASPISFMEAIEIAKGAVALYQKIKNATKEIEEVGKIMIDLESYLTFLQALIDSKKHMQAQLGALWVELTKRLKRKIEDIRNDSQDVYDILDIFYRYGKVSRVLFPLGRNPKELKLLMDDLKQHRKALRADLQCLGFFAIGPAAPAALPASVPKRQPQRTDYTVTFIDPSNLGRSKVAEAYMKLVREWTVGTGGKWRIRFTHSAGMKVKARCDCVNMLENLKRPMEMRDGNQVPDKTALESLFDNQYFVSWRNFPCG